MLDAIVATLKIATVLYLVMAIYGLTRPPNVGNRLLVLVMFICAGWAAAYYQELAAPGLDMKLVWMRVRFAFVPFLSILWMLLAADLAGLRTKIPAGVWAVLFLVPVLTVPIATNMQHHTLFRHGFSLAGEASMQPLLFRTGPWSSLYELHNLVLQLASLVFLSHAWRKSLSALRRPIGLVLLCSTLPLAGNTAFVVWPGIANGLNPALIFLFPAACALAAAVFRGQLLDVGPIVRDLVFDHIHDGILVIDSLGRITDLNTSAKKMLGTSGDSLRDRHVGTVPSPWAAALDILGGTRLDFEVPSGEKTRWYERRRIRIIRNGSQQGWMFVLEDITDRVMLERQHILEARAEEEFKRIRQWALLLRDLHDGIGGISANIALLANIAQKTENPEAKNGYLLQIADLAHEGNIEVRTMMNSIEARDMAWPDLFAEIRRFAALVLEPCGIRFALRVEGIPGPPPGMANGTSIFRIVKETVTNAAKHSHASVVYTDLRFEPATVELEISDDGRWREDAREGRGLRHLRQRVQEMGGTFELQKSPGTRIRCVFPQAAAEQAGLPPTIAPRKERSP